MNPIVAVSNNVVALTNGIVAAAAVGTAIVGICSIRAANRVATATEIQAGETTRAVDAATDQVSVSQESLAVETQALLASCSPLMAEVPGTPMVWSQEAQGIRIFTSFRNIGTGAAFVHGAKISGHVGFNFPAEVDRQVIPMGEPAKIETFIPSTFVGYPQATQTSRWTVWLEYGDLSGNQRNRTVVIFETGIAGPSRHGLARKLEIYECDEGWVRAEEPFVSTGYS